MSKQTNNLDQIIAAAVAQAVKAALTAVQTEGQKTVREKSTRANKTAPKAKTAKRAAHNDDGNARASGRASESGVYRSHVLTDAGRIKTPKELFDTGDGRTFEYVYVNVPNFGTVPIYPNAGAGRGRLSNAMMDAMNVQAGHTLVYTRVDNGVFDLHVEGKAAQHAPQTVTPKSGKVIAPKSAAVQTVNGFTREQLADMLAGFEPATAPKVTQTPKRAGRKAGLNDAPIYAAPSAGRSVNNSAYVVPERKGRR